MKIKYDDGQPCNHRGCLNHISHPCEGCGRTGGKGIVYYNGLEDISYILPKQDKPIKVIYEELPCPVLSQLGNNHRCKYAQSKTEDMNFILYCSNEDCEIKVMIN